SVGAMIAPRAGGGRHGKFLRTSHGVVMMCARWAAKRNRVACIARQLLQALPNANAREAYGRPCSSTNEVLQCMEDG
ncbi:hypothetical protein CATMIT_01624, partial [Catenibacterium mitsuokai DSM 15897]